MKKFKEFIQEADISNDERPRERFDPSIGHSPHRKSFEENGMMFLGGHYVEKPGKQFGPSGEIIHYYNAPKGIDSIRNIMKSLDYTHKTRMCGDGSCHDIYTHPSQGSIFHSFPEKDENDEGATIGHVSRPEMM